MTIDILPSIDWLRPRPGPFAKTVFRKEVFLSSNKLCKSYVWIVLFILKYIITIIQHQLPFGYFKLNIYQ